jgi:streptogramin lyase
VVAIGTLVIIALAVVATAILWPNGDPVRTGASASPAGRIPGVLLRIDPRSGDIVASVDLRPEHASNAVAFGDGFLWVLERGGVRKVNEAGTVVGERIAAGSALGCPGLGGLGCVASISAGEGSAWVAATISTQLNRSDADSRLAKIDPLTNRIETFPLNGIAPGGVFSWLPLATGEGWVWTIDRNPPALVRLDPANPRERDRFPLSEPGDGVGVGFGSVWVRHNTGTESFLTRMDPTTGRVLETIPVPGSADGFAFGGGSVWVSDSTNDDVVEIDPVSNSIVDHFDVGVDPGAVVVDDAGGVWVNLTGERTDDGTGVLAKVDPLTGEVVNRIPLGGAGGIFGAPTSRTGLLFAFDSVWVA